jgi:hypothetical protein
MATHEPDIAIFTWRKVIFRDGRIISDTRKDYRCFMEKDRYHI